MIRWGLALGLLGLVAPEARAASPQPGVVVRLERARAAGDREALRALARWGRLDLAALRDVLSDPGSAEPVLLTALALCRDLPPSGERDALVLDQIRRSRGFRVAWAAFRLLRESGTPQERVGPEVARFLAGLPDRHAGPRAMAAYLAGLGYRVEHAAGA